MELRRMLLPVALSPMTMTPLLRLPKMVLAASATVPPIRLPGAPEMNTPWKLPRTPVPFTSVPMRLPWTLLFVALLTPVARIETPVPPLPEIALRAPATVPPTMLPGVSRRTPTSALPRSEVPFASVPMKLPSTLLKVALSVPEMKTPFALLPEMTLRAPALVPPITVLLEFPMRTPSWALPKSELPLKLVPMRLPSTLLNVEEEPAISAPCWPLSEIVFPCPLENVLPVPPISAWGATYAHVVQGVADVREAIAVAVDTDVVAQDIGAGGADVVDQHAVIVVAGDDVTFPVPVAPVVLPRSVRANSSYDDTGREKHVHAVIGVANVLFSVHVCLQPPTPRRFCRRRGPRRGHSCIRRRRPRRSLPPRRTGRS